MPLIAAVGGGRALVADEPEAARLTRRAVGNDDRFDELAEPRKEGAQVTLRRHRAEAADEQLRGPEAGLPRLGRDANDDVLELHLGQRGALRLGGHHVGIDPLRTQLAVAAQAVFLLPLLEVAAGLAVALAAREKAAHFLGPPMGGRPRRGRRGAVAAQFVRRFGIGAALGCSACCRSAC